MSGEEALRRENEELARELAQVRGDFDTLRRAVIYVMNEMRGAEMERPILRPSGSANGGSIRASLWWWILRGADERCWPRYGRPWQAKDRGEAPWVPEEAWKP